MAIYSTTSPYYGTPTWGPFLDLWKSVSIPEDVTDALYQIDPPYNLRPDLLAYDIYQDSNLWWVFAVRNPDVLVDPLFSFVAPNIIYVPSKTVISKALGL
jgi:Base plate wedge protein 53